MKKLLLITIASLGVPGCSSAPTAEPAPLDVIVQWSPDGPFLERQPVYYVEAMPAAEVILNVATPRTHGHSSLLSPAATCPETIIRVRGDGEVERAIELPTSGRRVPTLNARCFPIRRTARSLPDER